MCFSHLDQRVWNLVVDVGGGDLGSVAAVEGEGDGLVGAAADLRQRLGRLGRQDGALAAQLVHVDHVLKYSSKGHGCFEDTCKNIPWNRQKCSLQRLQLDTIWHFI